MIAAELEFDKTVSTSTEYGGDLRELTAATRQRQELSGHKIIRQGGASSDKELRRTGNK